ncbi:MAG: CotH kinase family protein [Bacteroidetes bacterium]|nr:CotH kinase family protein [Bacteroidota bacterium]
MKKIICVIFFINLCNLCFSQIVINEVCSKNNSIIKDEDGDFSDWLELFNSGATAINLNGYYLSDDFANLSQWQFPAITIQPQKYLVVFASGKNRKTVIDHWETPVNANDFWRYIIPVVQPVSSWNTVGFNDTGWNLGIGGFGYGDGDDNTLLTPPLWSVFTRKTFTVSDTSKITAAILTMDYDDAFVAYVNGVEIARSNIGVTGTPPPFNMAAFKEHEALLYQGQLPENFQIDMSLLKSVLVNGTNVLSIQTHNNNNNSSDLSSIPFLSFGIKDASVFWGPPPAWIYLGKSTLHTNFKLNGNGETIYLSDASQTVVDMFSFPYLQLDNSYGRFPDANPLLVYFGTPTPDSTNNGSVTSISYVSDPIFSLPAGFYNGSQTLALSCNTVGAAIRYTTDGSTPKQTSSLYSSLIAIDSTMVIRAHAFIGSGQLPSETVTNTYFINDSASLPVISLSTDPGYLFDWNSGIYVLGPNADTMSPFFNANFWQDWEVPANIEYFDKQNIQAFEQGVGIRIQGNYSRANPQKSFKVAARSVYGKSKFDYQFFPDKEITEFNQIILRNAGNDWNGLHFRDAVIHKLCNKKTDLDVQGYQPCLVFINGEYWGVYNIREKINKDYIAENHGVNPDSIDLLQYNGLVMDGNVFDFYQFATFVLNNNLDDTANYSVVKSWLDIDNFIDYFVVETYSENGDWLTNNVRFWREQKNGAKWRHILWDLDFFGTSWWSFTASSLDSNLNKPFSFQSILFNKLVQNIEFRNQFINRNADLLNTIFTPDYLKNYVAAVHDSLDPEMKRHFARWGFGVNEPAYGLGGQGNYNDWKYFNLSQLNTFINYRPTTARNQIQNTASLKKQVPVTFNVYPPGAGSIELNTIELDSFPWAGIYFDSVPITFKAVPNPGYQFAFWQSTILIPNPNFNQSIKINVDTSDVFTAYFFGSPDTNRIVLSEINYKSSTALDAGDWVELYNYGTVDIDISGWKFKDSVVANSFFIPQNTILAKNNYLVLCQDTAKFKAAYPNVNNYVGPFNFGLSSGGDYLRLFDKNENLFLSMTYSNTSPWPTGSNGTGKTLELLDENGSMNNPFNWFSGCVGGSPGVAFFPCPLSVDEEGIADNGLNLSNFPNPYNNSTTITFTLKESGLVRLIVVDAYGKQVFTLLNEQISSGTHNIPFNPGAVSSGIYFYQVSTAKLSETKIMQLIK